MNRISLELEARVRHEVRIHWDSIRQTQYCQLTSDILESDMCEFTFYQSLREMKWMFLTHRDIRSWNLSRFRHIQTLLPSHKWHSRVWNRWIFFFSEFWEIWIGFILEWETYEVGIFQDPLRNRHCYQLMGGIIEFETGKLGFC